MKKLIYYIEFALIALTLYFIHFPLPNFKYSSTVLIVFIVIVYRFISIYKSRELKKIDSANRNIIADVQERLKHELQTKVVHVNKIEPEQLQEIDRDQSIINKLKDGQSGKSISDETGVHVSTISRLKKKYVD